MEAKVIVEVEHIEFAYKKNQKVLNDVSFKAKTGEIVGILGENGSGKSTLLKILAGILKEDQGKVQLYGTLGYCPQEILLFDFLTVTENLELFGTGMGLSKQFLSKRAKELMRLLNFEKYEHELVRNLSEGTKQKVNFAISILHDPDILLLDEPYQGFDYDTFQRFWELQGKLRQRGKTVLIVSHLIEDRSRLDKTVTLRDGFSMPCDPDCTCSSCLQLRRQSVTAVPAASEGGGIE
ncbi:MAG: ABC transporter ATP-binding protein [Candidatus Heimdallarchaeota archaeon]